MKVRPSDWIHFYLVQIENVALKSLPLVLISVGFAAFVTVLESSFHMKLVVQNDSLVPGFAALLILRELAVVVTGLMLVSRVGASMTAELAVMYQTEQMDALRIMRVDPFWFLLPPRFFASLLAGLVLTLWASAFSLLAAALASFWSLGISPQNFLASMSRFVESADLYVALLKGCVFGAIIPLVAFYFAARVPIGADGVGRSTTRSVVGSAVLIIFSDLLISWIFMR